MAVRAPARFWSVFKQSLVSLTVDLAGLIAGAIVASNLDLVQMAPWTIILYPAILSMRGTVGGIFSGHFSTGLHLGTMRPSLLGNTDEFKGLVISLLALSVIGSSMLWLVAAVVLSVMGVNPIPMLAMLFATTGLGFVAILPISTKVIAVGYRRGLDPDISSYPIESTVADVVVTIVYVGLLFLYSQLGQLGLIAMGLFDLAYVSVIVALAVSRRRDPEFRTIVKESALALAASSVLVNITGIVLVNVAEVIREVRLVYMTYPSIIDTVGDVGAIVGSMLTTKLALGELSPSIKNIGKMMPEAAGALIASALMFQVYGLISAVALGTMGVEILVRLSLVLLTTNLMATSTIAVVSFVTACVTYGRGLNPDSFVIPVESALADSLTTLSLLLSVLVVGLA